MDSDVGNVPQLDETDRAIIHAYWLHPKSTYASVARDVDASEATVRRRVQALIAADVLQFTVVLGPPASSEYLEFIVGLHVEGDRVDEVADALERHERIRFLATAIGSFDIILAAALKSFDDWKQLRADIGRLEGVRGTESHVITEVRKRSLDSYTPDDLAQLGGLLTASPNLEWVGDTRHRSQVEPTR